MENLRRILSICAITFCQSLEATPGQALRDACRSAGSVVLGTVETAVVTSRPAKLTVRVDGVISGPIRANTTISATWPGSLMAVRIIPRRYRALWFLRPARANNWEIMPIGGPNAPLFASALAIPPFTLMEATSCLKSVLTVLSQNGSYIEGSLPHLAAVEMLLQEDPALSDPARPAFLKIVDDYTQSSSVDLRTLAIASGVRRQEVPSIRRVNDNLASLLQSKMLHHLTSALAACRNNDPEALAALGALAASSPENPLSRYAAEALMRLHSKLAVPYLVKLLEGQNAGMRAFANQGLSLFVSGVPALTPDKVRPMQHLTKPPNEFLDEEIAPFVLFNSVAPEVEGEFTSAWKAWSKRHPSVSSPPAPVQ